jgi:hypothetical protein
VLWWDAKREMIAFRFKCSALEWDKVQVFD